MLRENEGRVRTIFELLADAEVGDLDTALVVDKNIRALQITMHDPALMHIIQPL